ncbi:MAG: phospho-N-acetylmuramoyl-pentapeptide-transferase [Bacilli bacterium]|nr:phospho-N-acetylmuramoyl-pentapeptide-transferase [Bacilli bacterium]
MFKTLVVLFLSLLIEIVVFSFYIKILKKREITQSVREEGPREHYKKRGTPTAGGCLIIIFLLINYFTVKIINKLPLDKSDFIFIITILSFSFIGLLDDLKIIRMKNNKGLTPKIKLLLEIIFSIVISLFIFTLFNKKTITVFNYSINLGFLSIFVLAFLIIGWSNSYNITDGLDGLSSGLTFIYLIGVFIIGKISKNTLLTVTSISMFFSIVAFLIFNFHPALVFMGNVGSHGLGAGLAVMSILSDLEMIFIVMGFVFIFETISVILQVLYFKKTKGKRIFKMAPFHHHLELTGYDEYHVNYFLYCIEIIFVIIGLVIWRI